MTEYDHSDREGFRPYKGDVWSVFWVERGTNERCCETHRDYRKALIAPHSKAYPCNPATIQIVKNPTCWKPIDVIGWNGRIEPKLDEAA